MKRRRKRRKRWERKIERVKTEGQVWKIINREKNRKKEKKEGD